jgi:hypothetical protein
MIPELLVGQAVLHGIQNDGTQIVVSPYATFVLNKVGGNHAFEMKSLKDETDFTAAMVAVDEGSEIDIDLTISAGTSSTRAAAAALAVYPSPLQAVTLSHLKTQGTFASAGNTAVKLFDGTFSYLGGAKIDMSQGDFVKLTGMKLKKWANAAQNTSLTTVVSG